MKEKFIDIYTENIKREGSKELLEYLKKSDFFIAPASAKYHCSYKGGLCEHSINVYNRLLKMVKEEYGENWEKAYSHETIAICGLLHDLCKIDYYVEDFRNIKENGVWVQKPYYAVNEVLPYGHGEKSVYIISGFMRLSRAEAMAINWHMGGFDERTRGGNFQISVAYEKEPLCVLMHMADLIATYLDENRNQK